MATLRHSSSLDEDIHLDVPFLPAAERRNLDDEYDPTSLVDSEQLPACQNTFQRRVLIISTAVMLGLPLGAHMIPGPMTRIIESIACRQHFASHDPSHISPSGTVNEELCKISEVQTTVTFIKGYSDFFEGLSTTVCSIPFGLLADRYGRKRAIRLTFAGFLVNAVITNNVLWFSDVFPLWSLWLAALSWMIGGGPTVTMAVLWTMVADVTTGSQRTTINMRILVITMAASFVSKFISSSLMSLDPWVPLMIGCGILLFSLSCIFLLPETFEPMRGETHIKESISIDMPEAFTARHESKPHEKRSSWDFFLSRLHQIFSPYIFIFESEIALLLSLFFIYQLSDRSSFFLIQFISTRLRWSLATSNLVTSLQPAINIPVFLFGIPYLSKKYFSKLPLILKDQYLLRMSSVCLFLGTMGIGLSISSVILIPSLIIQAAGSGFLFILRSIITNLVRREETARINTVIQVLESMGGVLGIYSFTNIFTIGLEIGGIWTGLGWMISSVLFGFVLLTIWLITLPKGRNPVT